MPHESRLNFSTDEILANVPTREALIVKGVKCHGGFDADGNYRSPRTAFRVPAIKAWQEQHVATSGTALFEIPADTVSPQVPNVAQVKFLLKSGVREPMVRWLSEIAIVEGFGAMIRELPVPPLSSFIREDTAGTALAHLTSGLFEAHARDEAGWTEEGGHRQMWDAARDAALSNPAISAEIYTAIIARRGAGQGPGDNWIDERLARERSGHAPTFAHGPGRDRHEAMRICVIGAGAIGGVIAARLAAVRDADVSVLARGATLAAVREHGLRVSSPGPDGTGDRRADDAAARRAHRGRAGRGRFSR